MSLYKYHAILDDGRRCQSCCNRWQIFGAFDWQSGWENDCGDCIVRWYRGQVVGASRDLRNMVAATNLFGLGVIATTTVFLFAKLDVRFYRHIASLRRRIRMFTASLTNPVDSDGEYFEHIHSALPWLVFPLTCLRDITLQSRALQQELLREVPIFDLSLLDAIALYLLEIGSVSRKCVISYVQGRDYALEACWKKYISQGRYWMHNFVTEEWFYVDDPHPWKRYAYKSRLWWMHGSWSRTTPSRWFWEP
jgi:hypothetical protein